MLKIDPSDKKTRAEILFSLISVVILLVALVNIPISFIISLIFFGVTYFASGIAHYRRRKVVEEGKKRYLYEGEVSWIILLSGAIPFIITFLLVIFKL